MEGTAAAKDLALTQLADFFFARAKDWGEVGVPGDEAGPAEVPLEFDLEKGEDLNFSFSTTERAALGIAAKGLLGWEETHGGEKTVKAYMRFQNFNEWTLLGDTLGFIETQETDD